ncbi:MAG: hypothetical protein F6J97_12145 [Leptolyngbya sp. SIO4C1]|nr:hypothetical protein [Leptolyngbya sp. SIO4C1]
MEKFVSDGLLLISLLLGPFLLLCLTAWFAVSALIEIRYKLVRLCRLRSTPCRHCCYYTGCKELACAVQPYKVLTPAAKDCPDFALTESPRSHSLDYYKSELSG